MDVKAYRQPDLVAVLLSGGLDSTTALHIALDKTGLLDVNPNLVHAISFDYAQRHASKELEVAGDTCDDLGITHHILDLSAVIPDSMLTNPNKEIPDIGYEDIEGVSPTYVPFRNGLMMSAATSHVVGLLDSIANPSNGYEPIAHLYCGIHSDDAAGFAYPDCTPEFFGSAANMIYTGTYGRVRLIAPLLWMDKSEIITRGDELGVDFGGTWSCYKGGAVHCGSCPTCRARRKGFIDADVNDPTDYESLPPLAG